MSALTEPERLVSRPDQSTLYMSRRSDLRLVKLARYPMYGPMGQKVGEHKGQAVQFREGRIDVPLTGDYELENGDKIPASEVVEFLDNHKLNRSLEEGFWRVDPVAPPVSQDEIDALLSVSFDEGKLVALIEQERNGWGREELIGPAERQLEKLREVIAQADAEKPAPKPAAKK